MTYIEIDIEDCIKYMKGGRPPLDREDIARQLLQWAQLPKSTNLNAFCAFCKPPISPAQLLVMSREEGFKLIYAIVKGIIAAKREELNARGEMTNTAFNIGCRLYDLFLDEKWKEEKKFEKELDIKKPDEQSPELIEKYLQMVEVFKSPSNSFSSSQRNIEDINMSNETKS